MANWTRRTVFGTPSTQGQIPWNTIAFREVVERWEKVFTSCKNVEQIDLIQIKSALFPSRSNATFVKSNGEAPGWMFVAMPLFSSWNFIDRLANTQKRHGRDETMRWFTNGAKILLRFPLQAFLDPRERKKEKRTLALHVSVSVKKERITWNKGFQCKFLNSWLNGRTTRFLACLNMVEGNVWRSWSKSKKQKLWPGLVWQSTEYKEEPQEEESYTT